MQVSYRGHEFNVSQTAQVKYELSLGVTNHAVGQDI